MRIVSSFGIVVLFYTLLTEATPNALPAPNKPTIPFIAASPVSPVRNVILEKRQQGDCQANFISCASLSADEACCPNGTNCARDGAGNIACCPNNFLCTGTVGGSGSPATTSSGSGGSSITSGGQTSGITPAPNPGSGITVGSTVPNIYFGFPYIATTYANSGACLSAFTFCQQQSSSCFAALASQNGVTISNGMGGGGVTQVGAPGVVQGSASALCSSLSMTACYGLQSAQCSQFGSGGGGGATGVISDGQGPRETGCAGLRYMAAVGVVGAVGLVM